MKCGLGKYSNRIWITGALPGVRYGSEVNWSSGFELLKIRRGAGNVLRPGAKGRSLTATMICHNDPVWLGAVPPIVRYSKEVWSLQSHSYPHSLSWAQLREGWEAVFAKPEQVWRQVAGPLSALRLSLKKDRMADDGFRDMCQRLWGVFHAHCDSTRDAEEDVARRFSS